MEHSHTWIVVPEKINVAHIEGEKDLTYTFMEICECGVYRVKEYKKE